MRVHRNAMTCAVLLWSGLVGVSSASAEVDAEIVAIKTNVSKCTTDVAFRVKDAGDYFANMWDDGSFRGGAGGAVAQGETARVRFTIGGPILQGASGIGFYVEDAAGLMATTTYDANGSTQAWGSELGNLCVGQGKTFGASFVSEEFPVGTKLLLQASLGPNKPRVLSLFAKDPRIAVGRGGGSPDDPVVNGGSLRVLAEGGTGFDDTYPLPAAGWKYASAASPSKGFSFSGEDAIAKVIVKAGKQIKISAKSDLLGHTLTPGPDAVIVELRLGARRYCFRFGGATTLYVQDRSFTALNAAPDENACPD